MELFYAPTPRLQWEASEVWILEHGGEEIFQEYATAQEEEVEEEVPLDEEPGGDRAATEASSTDFAELEAQPSTPPVVPARPARELFPQGSRATIEPSADGSTEVSGGACPESTWSGSRLLSTSWLLPRRQKLVPLS